MQVNAMVETSLTNRLQIMGEQPLLFTSTVDVTIANAADWLKSYLSQ